MASSVPRMMGLVGRHLGRSVRLVILCMAVLGLALGCDGADEPVGAGAGGPTTGRGDGGPDAAGEDGGAGDAGARGDAHVPDEDAATVPGTPVSHERELRGVWIATAYNINFPSRTGLSPEAQRDELRAIVDVAEALRLNAIFFQVRPEGDAFYPSDIEPWSRFLMGTQGVDPGWDPFAFLLEEAHGRAIEVHAWLNPFRAQANASVGVVAPHIAAVRPDVVVRYGSAAWMDPASEVVQQRLLDVVEDLVRRYPVDGVHLDDYFYPYPNDEDFPDDASWDAYRASGGALSRGDWRRDNVNRMVRRLHEQVRTLDSTLRFGISPFGIYRPGTPAGIRGLDQYAEIYADPPLWMREGWVDYLAPQLYWPSTQAPQAYGKLIDWWSSIAEGGRHVFAGNYLSKLGTSADWTVSELVTQVELGRAHRDRGSRGNIFFHVEPFATNRDGVRDRFREEVYPHPALPPAHPAARGPAPSTPRLTVRDGAVLPRHPERASLRAWVLYRDTGVAWAVDRILSARAAEVAVEPGRWALSAVDRAGRESLGAPFEVD